MIEQYIFDCKRLTMYTRLGSRPAQFEEPTQNIWTCPDLCPYLDQILVYAVQTVENLEDRQGH